MADSLETTVTLSVIDEAPVADDDTYAGSHAQTMSIDAAHGLLANDFDSDDDPLTVSVASGPAHGTLTLSADGSFTYTANAGYVGADSFTYDVSDGASTDQGTVTLDLTNSDPVAAGDAYGLLADGGLTLAAAAGVLANDTDADQDSLTATLLADVSHGVLSLSSDGSFTYTPDSGYSGDDSFTYTLSDGVAGAATDTATVTLHVYTDHVVAVDDDWVAPHDQQLAGDVLANDFNADAVSLSASLVSDVSNGTLSLNADGTFTYTPDAGYTGPDSFTYQLDDGSQFSNEATVSFDVAETLPDVADLEYNLLHDREFTVPAPGLLPSAGDAEGDALTLTLVDDVTFGGLIIDTDGGFTYDPQSGFTGDDTFTYTLSDGLLSSDPVTVTLHVANTAPVATDDTYQVTPDAPLDVAAGGLLANDSDADRDRLQVTLVGDVAHGDLNLSDDGSFTYTPASGYIGQDSFTYQINDGAADSSIATVTLNVVDPTPVTADDSYEVPHDADQFSVATADGVLANDSDDEAMTAALVAAPAHGTLVFNADGSFTYTPDAGYFGDDTFTYSAGDGTTSSLPATVTLSVVNAAPLPADDDYEVQRNQPLTVVAGVLANDFDPDGDTLTAALVSDVAHGALTLNPDGTFTYTPAAGFAGTDTFTYQPSDGLDTGAVATVTLEVLDEPPTAHVDQYYLPHNAPLVVTAADGVVANDWDPEGDALTAVLVTDVSHGTLALAADGSFTYTPDAGYVGGDSFTYQANDGSALSDAVTVTLEVRNSARWPTRRIHHVARPVAGRRGRRSVRERL